MKSVIEAKNLMKRFGTVEALRGVSFQVNEGEVFGFLGPNGAGKTTTINVLTGLARPDTGTIRMADIDCTTNHKAAQSAIGVVPDESNLYPELTGFENLCFCASLYGMNRKERRERARELLDAFGLNEAAERRFGGYSKGMKRKLTVAAGMVHRPPLLFLDEPTTGIDVANARRIRQMIADLHHNGVTIFLTTHYIEEAERLCDRIAILVKGKIVHLDRVSNLMQSIVEKQVMMVSFASPVSQMDQALRQAFPELDFYTLPEGAIRVESHQPILVSPLVRFFEERGREVVEARRLLPSLEDVFVRITGIEAELMRREQEKTGGRR